MLSCLKVGACILSKVEKAARGIAASVLGRQENWLVALPSYMHKLGSVKTHLSESLSIMPYAQTLNKYQFYLHYLVLSANLLLAGFTSTNVVWFLELAEFVLSC